MKCKGKGKGKSSTKKAKEEESSTPMNVTTAQVKACLADVAKNENYISIIEQKKELMEIKLEREQFNLKGKVCK